MRERLLKILTETCPAVDFEGCAELIDSEALDSLDIVMIVPQITEEFRIEITVDDLQPENFNSVDAMLELISRRGGK